MPKVTAQVRERAKRVAEVLNCDHPQMTPSAICETCGVDTGVMVCAWLSVFGGTTWRYQREVQ